LASLLFLATACDLRPFRCVYSVTVTVTAAFVLRLLQYSQPRGASHNQYDVLNKKVFKWRLEVVVDDRMIFTSVGSRFHARSAATEYTENTPYFCSLYVLLHKCRSILFDGMFSQCLLTFLYHFIGGRCSTLFWALIFVLSFTVSSNLLLLSSSHRSTQV